MLRYYLHPLLPNSPRQMLEESGGLLSPDRLQCLILWLSENPQIHLLLSFSRPLQLSLLNLIVVCLKKFLKVAGPLPLCFILILTKNGLPKEHKAHKANPHPLGIFQCRMIAFAPLYKKPCPVWLHIACLAPQCYSSLLTTACPAENGSPKD